MHNKAFRSTALLTVHNNGMALKHFPQFQDDVGVALQAMLQNRAAMKYVAPNIQGKVYAYYHHFTTIK